MKHKNILLIAGEVSADQHGAHLIAELKKLEPALSFWGIGGDSLAAQGMKLLFHLKQMSFLGIGEVLQHLPFIFKVLKQIKLEAQIKKPDLAILIDYPGFNLRLASALKKMGIPIVYYISPQLWAWGKGRIKKIRAYVDLMLVLFPFEKTFYEQHGVKAIHVGHPLVDRHFPFLPEAIKKVQPGNITLGLLPGSRQNEIQQLLPRMVQTAKRLVNENKVQRVLIARVPHLAESFYRSFLGQTPVSFHLVQMPMEKLLPQLDAAIVASGTATLEAAYYAVPMIIVYHVNTLTFWLGRLLIKLKHIGLANIVAEQEIAPELIQNDFNVEKAVHLLDKMLNPQVNEQLRQRMLIIRQKLGKPGASRRAAEQILQFLQTQDHTSKGQS